MTIASISNPESTLRAEVWTFDRNTSRETRVPVIARRDPLGRWAAGRIGNGARR